MSQPTPYQRGYSFRNFQTAFPTTPLPGDKVDIEYNNIRITLDQILANLALIQRDDGRIANSSIGVSQMDGALISLGFERPTNWATTTSYVVDAAVFQSNKLYICLVAHTSGVFATDLAAGKWVQTIDFTTLISDAAAEADAAAASAAAALASQLASAQSASDIAGNVHRYYGAATGTNNYTISAIPTYTPAAPTDGIEAVFFVTNGNTTAVNLTLGAWAQKAVKRYDGTALKSGDWPSGSMVRVVYKTSTDQFYWLGTPSIAAAGAAQWAGALTGTSTTYVAASSGYFGALFDGLTIRAVIQATNTSTTPTLNYNTTGAVTIVRADGSALANGDMIINQIGQFTYYSSTAKWYFSSGGGLNSRVVTATPSTDETNFTATGLSDAVSFKQIELAPTACINLNSVAGISNGERLTICNTLDGTAATARMIIIPHEHAASTAANRFNFADKMPRFLLPGESLSFIKFGDRLRLASKNKLSDGFDVWNDCHDVTGTYRSDASGTGADAGVANYLVSDATQQPRGVVSLRTGTTTTGSASIGGRSVADGLVPTKGHALFFARVAVGALSTAGEEFSVKAGFNDMTVTDTDVTDGVYWEYLRGTSVNWSMNCAGGGTRSKTATSVAVDTNYVWLGIYINGDWSRADFFISQDGRTYTWAGNQTGGNMPTVTEITDVKVVMKKSAGTTSRDAYVDILAHRYDTFRGA